MKLKARSRLNQNVAFSVQELPLQKVFVGFKAVATVVIFKSDWWRNWWQIRKTKLTQLIIGLTAYVLVYYLLNHFYPSQLRDFLWPKSFLSLIALAGIGHLYLGSFLTLKPKLAFFVSLALSWLLWLKLHQFVVDQVTLTVSLCVGISLGLLFEFATKSKT